jgi:hypothetical protein
VEDHVTRLKRSPRTARTPHFAALAVAAAMCDALFTAVQPAAASADPVTHPERDWLGSQVAKRVQVLANG